MTNMTDEEAEAFSMIVDACAILDWSFSELYLDDEVAGVIIGNSKYLQKYQESDKVEPGPTNLAGEKL